MPRLNSFETSQKNIATSVICSLAPTPGHAGESAYVTCGFRGAADMAAPGGLGQS